MQHEAFYSTSAQVIPVLVLALVLQIRRPSDFQDASSIRSRAGVNIVGLMAGGLGLVGALGALLTRRDSIGLHWLVGGAAATVAYCVVFELIDSQSWLIAENRRKAKNQSDSQVNRFS